MNVPSSSQNTSIAGFRIGKNYSPRSGLAHKDIVGAHRRCEKIAEAEGKGSKSMQILRSSPVIEASPYRARASHPLPEGEGESSATFNLFNYLIFAAARRASSKLS